MQQHQQVDSSVMRLKGGGWGAFKDIVHQASDQLAEVGVVRDPHVVLSGVHCAFQVGFTEAPARCAVVLATKYTREGCDVST